MLLFTPPAKMPGWVVILSVGFTRGTTMASKLLLLGAFMVQLTIEFDFVSTGECKQTGPMFRIVFCSRWIWADVLSVSDDHQKSHNRIMQFCVKLGPLLKLFACEQTY
jgi:hypothetical protein